jgi:DNA invertase Pin-like site-specific DNA recombinase
VTYALTYRRVSTSEQGKEGLSMDMQAKENARYVGQLGFYLGPQYSDVLSGLRADRPGYQALLDEIRRLRKAGEDVVVVVWRLDRFGRDTEERARSWKELTRLGVNLYSVTEGGPISETQAYTMALVAQLQVTAAKESIRRSLKNSRGSGWWTSGRCPYGYRWRPRTDDERARGAPKGVLDIEPLAAARVTEAFMRLARGESAGKVHRWLASLSDDERGGRVMHRRSVFLMFKAPLYMARFEDGQAGNWPALVDEQTWTAAQRVFDGHKAGTRAARGRYLLSGFLKCPVCGHPMVGTSVGTPGRQQARYRCKGRERGLTCKETVTIGSVDQEARARLAELLEWLVDPPKRARLLAAVDARRTKVTSNSDREQRQLQHDIERDRARLFGAMDKWNDGKMSDDEYYGYRQLVEQRVKVNTERLSELASEAPPEPDVPSLEGVLGPAPTWLEILRESEDIEALRRVLAVFIKSVVAHRTSRGRYDVSVEFTDLGNSLVALTAPAFKQVG